MFEPISINDFANRTGITPNSTAQATKVVSLRDIVPGTVASVHAMPVHYLEKLLRSVTLVGDETCRPYQECEFQRARVDSSALVVGQTFVQWGKCQDILVRLNEIMDGFCGPQGIAKRGAQIVFGQNANGDNVAAHYVPPIIEVSNNSQLLLDGIHRNFLVMGVGTTIESILVKGVKVPPPCNHQEWSTIRLVNEKPRLEDRYHGLRRDLFRNLKWIGVDG